MNKSFLGAMVGAVFKQGMSSKSRWNRNIKVTSVAREKIVARNYDNEAWNLFIFYKYKHRLLLSIWGLPIVQQNKRGIWFKFCWPSKAILCYAGKAELKRGQASPLLILLASPWTQGLGVWGFSSTYHWVLFVSLWLKGHSGIKSLNPLSLCQPE